MKVLARKLLVAAVAIVALGFAQCVQTEEPKSGGNDTGGTDVAQVDTTPSDDAEPAGDTAQAEDTATAEDATQAEDTAQAEDTPSIEDTTPEEDVTPVPDVTTLDDTAEDATPAEDVPVEMDATPGDDAAMPLPKGACTNPADQAIVDSQGDDFDIEKISKDCVIANILGDPDGAKAKKCIQEATDLSDGCTVCFGDVALCGKDNCIGPCLADANSPGCVDCLDTNCMPAFEACSGLPTD